MTGILLRTEAKERELNDPFDDRLNCGAKISDLNPPLIVSYLKGINSPLYNAASNMDFETLCRKLDIIYAHPMYIKPKNIGLLFFSLDPEKFFPYAHIEVAHLFKNANNNYKEIFRGPLDHQLRSALMHIRNSVLQEQVTKVDGIPEANRVWNYPHIAVQEALINAVYHKAYDISKPIEVLVEPDKITITSYPGPERPVTQKELDVYHVSPRRYRNRRIGEFLKQLHLTTGCGTGIPKIVSAMRSNGSPDPIFKIDVDYTSFSTTLPIHPTFLVR